MSSIHSTDAEVSEVPTTANDPVANNGAASSAKRTKMADKSNKISYKEKTFLQLYFLMQACGTLTLAGTLIWILNYHGGFSWGDIKLRFNYHPILMLLGMVYLSGNSLLAFRVLRAQPKPLVKLVHAAIHIVAFTTASIGSLAVFTNHWELKLANLYSLHSWIGFSCLTLFLLQYVAGFYNFLYPTTSGALRSALLPYHVMGGFVIFGLASMAAVTGFTEKMIFGDQLQYYTSFSARMWWMNITNIFLIVFVVLVFYLASERSYKRHAVGEQLPLTQNFGESNASSPNK